MSERRSTRVRKEARYREYVYTKTPVRRAKPTYKKRRTLKFFEDQAAILPEIGEPDTEVECRLYTTEEIEASLALVEMAREGEEKRRPNQEEIDAAVALMDLSRNWEERRAAEQAEKRKKKSKKTTAHSIKSPPKKRKKE